MNSSLDVAFLAGLFQHGDNFIRRACRGGQTAPHGDVDVSCAAFGTGRNVRQGREAFRAGHAENIDGTGFCMRDKLAGPLHGGIDTSRQQFDRSLAAIIGDVQHVFADPERIKNRDGGQMGKRPLAGGANLQLSCQTP